MTPKVSQEPLPEAAKEDERVVRSKRVILEVASELLVAHGVSGLSVDEVSRHSGVAKTTIYRHWKTRSDLVIHACALISTAQEAPDSGSFEGDAMLLLLNLAFLLKTEKWPRVLPSIVDAAERDPELAVVQSQSQRGHARPYLQVIERAKQRGEIAADTDSSAIVAALVGPLFYRRWFSHEEMDETFVRSVVGRVLPLQGNQTTR